MKNNVDKAAKYIEDVEDQPIDVEDSISDKEILSGGFARVQAFVRTKSSKNAERVKRHKEKLESGEDGRTPVKQLNLRAPVDELAREALKEITRKLVEGEISIDDIARVEADAPSSEDMQELLDRIELAEGQAASSTRRAVELSKQLAAAEANAAEQLAAAETEAAEKLARAQAQIAKLEADLRNAKPIAERHKKTLSSGGWRAAVLRMVVK